MGKSEVKLPGHGEELVFRLSGTRGGKKTRLSPADTGI